jgi:ATP-dependent RNA helicase RhlE
LNHIDSAASLSPITPSLTSPLAPAPRRSGPPAFHELGLLDSLVRAAAERGYTTPTPIQVEAIPHVLAGKDLLGTAQTGTGKTAAFALPILQRLTRVANARRQDGPIRVLVLTPTRELAGQIGQSFTNYGRYTAVRNMVLFGGVSQHGQVRALRAGVDIVVATPGRLRDLISQRCLSLSCVEILVIDEADRMLDMGFLPDVRRILALLPRKRQTLLFSATMPGPVLELAETILSEPVRIEVAPVATVADRIEQAVYFVETTRKRELLAHVLTSPSITRALVFTKTKHGADRVTEQLARVRVRAEAIHGNKSQNARERALAGFKAGTLRVLVATDIASRGIDVSGVSHVINYDLPNEPEVYVHRIGRTARAGASGMALSFCAPGEGRLLSAIERLIRTRVPVVDEHPFRVAASSSAPMGRAGRASETSQRRPPRRRQRRFG